MDRKKSTKIKKIIDQFKEVLQEEIFVNKILLFGSYAKGHPDTNSDIDIVVVSPQFSKGSYMKNMQYLFRKAARIDSRLEPIPASPKEIRNPDHRAFLGQIIKNSVIFNY